jgi:hypothetical protein
MNKIHDKFGLDIWNRRKNFQNNINNIKKEDY